MSIGGNAFVLKPSEHTPQSGEWVSRVLEEAGVPSGLVQLAPSDREAGEAIVAERGIAKIFFTGSVAVGRKVAAAAGARGCPVVLELGGRDPFIVFAKMMIFITLFIWIRFTVPRLRYDQLMSFGWKVLLPLATLNVLVTAIIVGT